MSFTDFQFHPKVNRGIAACGYTAPTPIQQEAMPPILAGRDILGLAQTGTGKTAAFVLPLLQRLYQVDFHSVLTYSAAFSSAESSAAALAAASAAAACAAITPGFGVASRAASR